MIAMASPLAHAKESEERRERAVFALTAGWRTVAEGREDRGTKKYYTCRCSAGC